MAEYCRELRMGTPASTGIAERAFTNHFLRVRRDANRGMLTVTVELPLEAGELIEKALDKARDDACLEVPDLVDTSWSKRQADAFVTMLKEYLQGSETNETKKSSDNYLVNIHGDQYPEGTWSALAGDVGRSSVPIETVKRLCCDGKTVVMTETTDGEPLSIGRKSRVVPKGIERTVRARDKNTCRFPGCCNKRFVDIHHIEHWTFFRPDGIAVPNCGYHSRDMLDDDIGYEDPSPRDENPPRGGLLSAVEKLVNEPPPPQYFH